MPLDQSIFGVRTGANEAILPTSEEMNSFLDSPKKAGRMEPHRNDLVRYVQFLTAVEDFKQSRKQGGLAPAFHDKLYYGVLVHSGFFTPALRTAVEHFKYYRNALAETDLKKPVAFIKSAEEEISRLKPNKKEDAARIERLQEMIDERKKHLEDRKAQWPALRKELSNIAVYISDNLTSIRKLCEASIVTLVDLQIGKKAESQLIEDIKTHFKDEIRDYLQHGPVTKEYVESTKETVARLSSRISAQLLEDIYAMTGLYEAIHDHAKSSTARLEPLIRQIAARPGTNLEEDKELFTKLEQELAALLSDFRFEVTLPQDVPNDTEQEKILFEKRRDMLERLFDLLKSR